jgi:hypothetical protein
MTEEMGVVLNQISDLLKRMLDRQDEMRRHFEESKHIIRPVERPDFKAMREESESRMEEGRKRAARNREEDVQFRERLLSELERHNRLLETLIERIGSSRNP